MPPQLPHLFVCLFVSVMTLSDCSPHYQLKPQWNRLVKGNFSPPSQNELSAGL